jgi:hypothetical protein
MKLKHFVHGIFWLLCVADLRAQPAHTTDWDIASANCFEFSEPAIDGSLGLKEVDRLLKESEELKRDACADAEVILRRRQQTTAKFAAIVKSISDVSIFYERNQLYELVKTSGANALAAAADVIKVTPRLSIENSKLLSDASTTLMAARERLADWARKWDALHQAREENPAARLKAIIADNDLAENMLFQAKSFLDTLPGYLFGGATAPRTSLEAYRMSVQALTKAVHEMREYYVSELKRQARAELVPIVAPELLRLQAEQFYTTIERNFPDPIGLAVVAYSEGGCLLAQAILRDRLKFLSAVIAQSPEQFKPFILVDIERVRARIEGRLGGFSKCDLKSANITLAQTISTRLAELEPQCARKSPELLETWTTIVQDAVITNVMDFSSKSNSDSYETDRQEHLGTVWQSMRKLHAACFAVEQK